MKLTRNTEYTLKLTEEEAGSIVFEINDIFNRIVRNGESPKDINTLLTLKDSLVNSMQ